MENTVVFLLLLLCALSSAEEASAEESSAEKARCEKAVAEDDSLFSLSVIRCMLRDMKATIDQLKKQNQVRQVAFSASLWTSGPETLGPYNTFTNLIFKKVISNIGNAYNSDTGFFTAPVRGAYHFEVYAAAGGQVSSFAVVKNGARIFAAHEVQTSGFGSYANGGTLLLEAKDVVNVQLWKGDTIFDNLNHHTVFSGHLLFPM